MKTILVVDDMAIFREPIEAILRANGFQVLTASNGVEACSLISARRPDLVLLDLGMPVMDGLTVLKKMRADKATKAIPVLVLSADGDRSHVVPAAKLGISGYLLKSHFSLKSMLESVTQALGASPSSSPPKNGENEPQTQPTPSTAPVAAHSSKPSMPDAAAGHVGKAMPRQASPPPAAPVLKHQSPSEGVKPATEADLKSLLPLMTRSELIERISMKDELTGFSPTISQVLKITGSAQSSMDQVTKAVSQDQAIALKVMKLANSSVYSRGDRVDSVHKAVLRIGMSSIRQAVLNIAVVERFGSIAFEKHLSTPLFWEHSIACGIIAAELAHELKHKEPDNAFTAGLLHDLGRIIYAERLGEQYVKVLETAQRMQLPLEVVESRLLLMNHAEMMEGILHAWRFPKELVNPIVFHHKVAGDVKAAAPHQIPEVLRLSLANRLAHAMLLGSSGNNTIYPTEEHCRILGIKSAMIGRIEGVARQNTDDTKFALLSNSRGAAWPRHAEDLRASLTAPFRPLYISESPELDAYRIFCNELAGPKGTEPPNIAVVHIAAGKERAGLSELLVKTELDLAVQGLPAIILSPTGQIALEDAAASNRQCMTIGTPMLISQFITAVNSLAMNTGMRAAA